MRLCEDGCLDRNKARFYILFQPIINFPTAIMFVAYIVWAVIVVNYKLYEGTPDISGPFSILATTIAVTLPLLASAAVQRNKESLFNYNAFCGDVMALGWEVLSYVRDEKRNMVTDNNQTKIHQVYQLLMILPTAVKWKFRNNAEFDIKEIQFVKNGKTKIIRQTKKRRRMSMTGEGNIFEGEYFKDTIIGKQYVKTLIKMGGFTVDGNKDDAGVDKCDLLFLFLFDIISEFEIDDKRKSMLTKTLERVYSSYGNMGNINDYKIPLVYETYMYIALFIFMGAFPFTYSNSGGELTNMHIEGVGENVWDATANYAQTVSSVGTHGFDIIWHGVIIIYFLFGMQLMTRKVANAFVSSTAAYGYNTVGKSETATNRTMYNLYKERGLLQRNIKFAPSDYNKFPPQIPEGGSKSETASLLTNRRKLYV